MTRIRTIGILHKNSYYIMQQYDYGSGDMGKLKCGVSEIFFRIRVGTAHSGDVHVSKLMRLFEPQKWRITRNLLDVRNVQWSSFPEGFSSETTRTETIQHPLSESDLEYSILWAWKTHNIWNDLNEKLWNKMIIEILRQYAVGIQWDLWQIFTVFEHSTY
jgi:hypothetical protein